MDEQPHVLSDEECRRLAKIEEMAPGGKTHTVTEWEPRHYAWVRRLYAEGKLECPDCRSDPRHHKHDCDLMTDQAAHFDSTSN